MDRRDTESLIKQVVDDKSVPIKVRARIMMAVGQRGLDDIDWLKQLARGISPSLPQNRQAEISQDEFGMILNAQRALGASKNPRAFDALLELAERSPANANFVEELGEKGDPRAIPVLIRALTAKPTASTARDHAAIALGKLKAREAVGPFIEIIKNDPDPLLVEKVASAAVAIGDKRVVPALQELVANLKSDPRFSQSAHPAFWNQERHGWGPIFSIKKALADLEK
jgi:HEAT repeat protein